MKQLRLLILILAIVVNNIPSTVASRPTRERIVLNELAPANAQPASIQVPYNDTLAALPELMAQTTAASTSNVITLAANGFQPTVFTTTVGADVVWINTTLVTHTLVSGEPFRLFLPLVLRAGSAPPAAAASSPPGHAPGLINSSLFTATLAPGGTFSYTFFSSGAVPYYLADMPHFNGRVIVQRDLPPDPTDVAPPLDPGVPTDLGSATEFLYSGENLIQTGVVSGTIEAKRVAVLRGRVLDRQGVPLRGVTITILDQPAFGQTLSREDGLFDMAVNGGGLLTVNYEKTGYLPSQRQVQAPWQDYAWLPDVVLIPLDSQVTTIDLNAATPIQVAQGSVVSDTDGIRQATLLVPQGTGAEMVLPDGTTQPLSSLNIRATEYTVSQTGPEAMPGDLPPTSGYTYALEYSVDEALAAGASDVRFNQPVINYVENFLGFPAGMAVPTGYYDRQKAAWVPTDYGRVVQILAVENGLARLDTTGNGQADDGATLGVSEAERASLASLYQPGESLWRVPLTHFTPWDHNWPYGPPDDAVAPDQPRPEQERGPDQPDCQSGSIIECQGQVLGEAVRIAGTPFRLFYTSDRVSGRKTNYVLNIPLSGAVVPASLARIDLVIEVAGRQFRSSYGAAPNQRATFTWDGKDAYGRSIQGERSVSVWIGYVYGAVYRTPAQLGRAFAAFGGAITPERARQEVTLWQVWRATLGTFQYPATNLGGWSLGLNHVYDPVSNIVYLGDGRQRSAGSPIITTTTTMVSNTGLQVTRGVAVGPDGSLYVAHGDSRVRRVSPDGTITIVAGNGSHGYSGDGGPATEAMLDGPVGLGLGSDGSIYIADYSNSRVRRVSPDGIITTVAGNGSHSFSGDGGPATQAAVNLPIDVAVGPDGSVYIADMDNDRIRRVSTDGIITTIAGTGARGYSGDGGPANQAALNTPTGVVVGPDGSVYIVNFGSNRVRQVTPDGIITTVAGNGTRGYGGDGGPATKAMLDQPRSVTLGPDGSLYIADRGNYRVRRVWPDGIITTMAGNGNGPGSTGDGGPATQATFSYLDGLAMGPDGSLYISDFFNYRIRRVFIAFAAIVAGDLALPSQDGTELYRFNMFGRHMETLDALTGAVRYRFTYDGGGRLASVSDGNGNVTQIERDANGNPARIVSQDGHRTTLTLNGDGYLSAIANPAGDTYHFTYTGDGLLTGMTDPNGSVWSFAYDALGRLVRDLDPAGGVKTLTRVGAGNNYTVSLTTALSRTTTYHVQQLATGVERRIITDPAGARTEITHNTDGSCSIRYPDGTLEQVTPAPDPRWGMQAPILQSFMRTLPSHAQETVTGQRTAVLADANNPLSLVSQTDQVTINGQVFTSHYISATRTLTVTGAGGSQRKINLDNHGRVIRIEATGMDPSSTFTTAGGVSAKSGRETMSGDTPTNLLPA